ncbi:hypothetical protein GCM10011395_23370 [Sphingomonas psychrolutea]|uniref:Uncharacterized protein n=1 Tax=Sphingomonas psychrolutea TaxID=1259676 RepID=A0ABQ1GXF5_9SPHN|nr:hypothetical protein GCM10011395_23370 [Sphingomonas psychrolutea]
MRIAIKFDHKPRRLTYEIAEERPETLLATELVAVKRTATEHRPEFALSGG